jgi:hypothetical protein
MQYIATHDFANPPGNPIVIADLKDDNGKVIREQKPVKNGTIVKDGKTIQAHIHKGVVFSIGTATEFKELSPAERTLVSQLMVSKKIAEASPKTIAKIDAEVKFDKERADRDEATAVAARGVSMSDVLKVLPELVGQAVQAALASQNKT